MVDNWRLVYAGKGAILSTCAVGRWKLSGYLWGENKNAPSDLDVGSHMRIRNVEKASMTPRYRGLQLFHRPQSPRCAFVLNHIPRYPTSGCKTTKYLTARALQMVGRLQGWRAVSNGELPGRIYAILNASNSCILFQTSIYFAFYAAKRQEEEDDSRTTRVGDTGHAALPPHPRLWFFHALHHSSFITLHHALQHA